MPKARRLSRLGTLAFRVERVIMLRSDVFQKEGPMAAEPPEKERGAMGRPAAPA